MRPRSAPPESARSAPTWDSILPSAGNRDRPPWHGPSSSIAIDRTERISYPRPDFRAQPYHIGESSVAAPFKMWADDCAGAPEGRIAATVRSPTGRSPAAGRDRDRAIGPGLSSCLREPDQASSRAGRIRPARPGTRPGIRPLRLPGPGSHDGSAFPSNSVPVLKCGEGVVAVARVPSVQRVRTASQVGPRIPADRLTGYDETLAGSLWIARPGDGRRIIAVGDDFES